jgi:hypothetical protein
MMPSLDRGAAHTADRRMALAQAWDELVEKVRRLEGFEDFLRAPPAATMLPAAAGGPVVILNVSRWRCDALIVTADGVRVQELPRLSATTVAENAGDYLRALQAADEAARALYLARQRLDDSDQAHMAIMEYTIAKQALVDARRQRDVTLERVVEWMWDGITEPILSALGFVGVPAAGRPWPRVWWCPTGLLTLLPLHAAGYHGTSDGPAPRTVIDRVVSSYTPTLRALVEARQGAAATSDDSGRLLMVAVPNASGEVPLGNVARERDLLAEVFHGRFTLLEDEQATWDAVRAELPRHRWAHFSCHGGQDLNNPSRGGLSLHDQALTVTDISAGRYRGEFAFLSACMTATGGVNLPDEAITLATALHYTGYRHVIGTLWSVQDDTAADVTQAVYSELASTVGLNPERAAHALHAAVRSLRDDSRAPLHVWGPFTHTGP